MKTKKKIPILLLTIILLFLTFFCFYKINGKNYEKHNEIKQTLVNHPENLPKKEVAKATSFGFENVKADYYWLKAIQYVGANAYYAEYKKYLYAILDLITELNPFFESPYIIGELLLPASEVRFDSTEEDNENEENYHTEQSIELGLKGIKNFCDTDKIDLIDKEDNLLKIRNNVEYKNPCRSYQIPFYLAYIYWFYKYEALEAAKYYKVASAVEDAPEGAKVMAAIMSGKGGNREKSFFMFLNLANSVNTNNDEVCSIFGDYLKNIGTEAFYENVLNGNLVKDVNDLRIEYFPYKKDDAMQDTQCSNYLNKAVRELNLAYVDLGEKKYFTEKGEHTYFAKDLYILGYLDYLPTDFQQYEDYGIIYVFDKNTEHYDIIMGKY